MRVLCANLHGISNTVALLSHFSVVYNCLDISRIYTGDECVLRRESGPWSAFRHAVTWAEQRFPQIKTNKRGILARRRKIILHLSCYQKEPLTSINFFELSDCSWSVCARMSQHEILSANRIWMNYVERKAGKLIVCAERVSCEYLLSFNEFPKRSVLAHGAFPRNLLRK